MTRLLALSDIHGNVPAVQELRAREPNRFDVVIVAGDLGSEAASDILRILSTFECPVLYVYGNWDHELAYDRIFWPSCHHLHLRAHEIGSLTFVGMSGCSANWGRNPILEELSRNIEHRCRSVLCAHEERKRDFDAAEIEIEAEHRARLSALESQAKDHRTSEYRRKVIELEARRDRAIARAEAALTKITKSKDYQGYLAERQARSSTTARRNRDALITTVQDCGAAPEDIVVVTHERLYRMHEHAPGIGLFLFGHQHGFSDTTYRASRFVNVSALDRPVTVRPASKARFKWEDCRSINDGNYVVVETTSTEEITVNCVRFNPSYDGWVPLKDTVIVGAPWVETE